MADEVNWPDLYPVFLNLSGARVLVVGAGAVGTRKIRGLVACGAEVTVVAPEASADVETLISDGKITWHRRPFVADDVADMTLVFAAAPERMVNEAVARAARALGVWANVADTPDLCSFYLPSVVDRAPLKMAMSTAGASPAYARTLRQRFENQIGESTSGFVELLGEMRERARATKPEKMGQISWTMVQSEAEDTFVGGDVDGAREILERILEDA